MIVKTYTTCLTALLLSAFLLLAALPPAFSQSASGERSTAAAQTSAEALFADALFLSSAEQPEAARSRLQQAMRLWGERREPGKAARAALQLGDRYKQLRDYREALYYYDQARRVAALPDSVRADACNAQGLVYAELYEMTLAERMFNQARELAHRANDLPARTLALTGLATLYVRQGEQAKALGYAEQARRLNQPANVKTEAALLSLIGQIHLANGRLQEAQSAFAAALAIYEQAGDDANQSRVLCALSTLSLRGGQTAAALAQAQQALAIGIEKSASAKNHAAAMDAWDLRWHAYFSCARAERLLGATVRARKSYLMATGLCEGLWIGWVLSNTTPTCAIGFAEETQTAYREYVDLLMEMGWFSDAFEMADRAKGRTILNRIQALHRSPPGHSEQASPLDAQAQAIAGLRLQLLDPGLSRERQAALQRAIEDAEADLQKAQFDAEIEHPKTYQVWSNSVDLKQLQAQTTQGQSALVEFLLGENHSYVWLFSRGQMFHATLPPRQQIEQAVREYLALLTTPPGAMTLERDIAKVRERGTVLFNLLFGALAEQLEPGQPLIIVADGLLNYLPFGALVHGGHYLIEDHDTTYNPSASILKLWQAAPRRAADSKPLELLAIGDPVFAPVASAGSRKPPLGAITRALPPSASSGWPFASLPWTRDEVQSIASLFPTDRRKVLLGREGTKAAFKRELASHYRRLHFATHSRIDEKTPSRSAVVLTPSGADDGLLDVNEISRLDFDCDLVVVSACQTGRGQLLSGEGIVGLSRAFLYAGARDVIVSLWDVSDNSTSQLMKDFYARLSGGMSNAAALRDAKLHMLGNNKVTRHPYYWASFIMVGKP